jgi:hypothetical protein
MGTNIYIQSDFVEPYDKYLHDPMGTIRWKRLSRGGRNRREIFKLIEEYRGSTLPFRNNVAPNGTVQELYDRYEPREVDGKWNGTWDKTGICSPFSELVIYRDEMAHRGEGKEVLDVEDAIEECPDAYASVFLRNNQKYAISRRNLYIGNRAYKFTYISLTDSWRSNCGHVVITYDGSVEYHEYDHIPFTRKLGTEIKSPIFAFDYVEIPVACSQYPDGVPEIFYVDFNEAAGIPEEVIMRDYDEPERRGELVPFSEIISFEEIASLAEKTLKSER